MWTCSHAIFCVGSRSSRWLSQVIYFITCLMIYVMYARFSSPHISPVLAEISDGHSLEQSMCLFFTFCPMSDGSLVRKFENGNVDLIVDWYNSLVI